ncbi:MAG: Cna B-type domain-containing protein [Dysosmobacter welbionis]
MNADGSWTNDFGSWPAYDDSGRAYTYTVQEEPVDGYGSRVDGWNVINGKGNLTVKKKCTAVTGRGTSPSPSRLTTSPSTASAGI